MVQHRTGLAVVGGAFTLLNASAAVGLLLYGFSVFVLSDRQLVDAPLFLAGEIAAALVLHVFHVLLGSVYVCSPCRSVPPLLVAFSPFASLSSMPTISAA